MPTASIAIGTGNRCDRLLRTDEPNDEQSSCHRLGSLAELRRAAPLEIPQLNRFAHDQPENPRLNVERLDVVKPVPTEIRMMLAKVAVDRDAELRIRARHGGRLETEGQGRKRGTNGLGASCLRGSTYRRLHTICPMRQRSPLVDPGKPEWKCGSYQPPTRPPIPHTPRADPLGIPLWCRDGGHELGCRPDGVPSRFLSSPSWRPVGNPVRRWGDTPTTGRSSHRLPARYRTRHRPVHAGRLQPRTA